ncbi:MAG: response regulator [Gammaproteobacteria bacterium]
MARIMAVDDSPSIRKMVTVTLMSSGHEVISAEDGVDAYELAKKENVDLVITDLYMPNLDGIGLVSKLRTLDNYRYLPILFLTTESSPDMKQRGKQAGATGWIVKPFEPSQLLSTLDKVL